MMIYYYTAADAPKAAPLLVAAAEPKAADGGGKQQGYLLLSSAASSFESPGKKELGQDDAAQGEGRAAAGSTPAAATGATTGATAATAAPAAAASGFSLGGSSQGSSLAPAASGTQLISDPTTARPTEMVDEKEESELSTMLTELNLADKYLHKLESEGVDINDLKETLKHGGRDALERLLEQVGVDKAVHRHRIANHLQGQ